MIDPAEKGPFMKQYFVICLLGFSITTDIHANLYFSNTSKETIPHFLSLIEKGRWHRLKTVYRIWSERGRKHWEKIKGKDYYSLKPTESLFFQISGLSLARVEILIYDARGALVRRLDIGTQRAGYYSDRFKTAYWNGRSETGEAVACGLYLYQLKAGHFTVLKRMLMLK